ncbi:uncharacterized protein LOC106464480 [Limulus polyphemus]|uniref:Uncharacterized protein LOC106464480 n=1 Tax=Limulus polyphemus TaxID=6850 RepID=A0ABM1BE01_LIMPO|nr:uncharacterized protein LOC106464480 [Limulus polyphemus]
MADLMFNYLITELEIDFRKCRRQSYDNAANMAGRYNSMQQKYSKQFARFIPCTGHSLNLVGHSAVDCCFDAVNFFGIINEINTFFSSSTKRWAVLKSFLQLQSKVPKYLSDTRWEAHAKATEAILESYRAVIDALSHLYSDVNEKDDTRLQANNLLQKMEELEFVFVLYFWTRVLRHFHKLDFDELEQQAKATLPNVNYRTVTRRQRVRKQQGNDENAPGPDVLDELSSRDKFRIKSFIPILDVLDANLRRRATVYSDVAQMFSFLANLTASKQEIQQCVELLMEAHPEDVDLRLTDELCTFTCT